VCRVEKKTQAISELIFFAEAADRRRLRRRRRRQRDFGSELSIVEIV